MSKNEDFCPVTDNGNHRYFIFKVVEVFEPVGKIETAVNTSDHRTAPQLYEKVEYAISGCNCGSAIRQRVKQ